MYRIPRRTALDVPTVLAAPAVVSSVAGKGSAFGAPAVLAVTAVVSSVAGTVTRCNVECAGAAEAAVSVFASSDAVSSMHHERSDVLDDCDAPDIVAPSDLRQHCLEMRNDECQRA